MTERLPYFYDTELRWTGGREGEISSTGFPTITIGAPPEFQGKHGVWTPEHFYVASVSSCFMTTFLAVAELSKLEFVSFACDSVGKLEKVEGLGYQITEIKLRPRLAVRHATDTERASRILEKAERNCLISKSIKTVISVEPDITIGEGEAVAEDLHTPLQ